MPTFLRQAHPHTAADLQQASLVRPAAASYCCSAPSVLQLGVGTTRTYYYDPQTQMWRPAGQHGAQSGSTSSSGEASTDDGGSLLASLVVGLTSLIATATLTVLIARFVVTARHNGVGRTLRRMLFEGFGGGWGGRREQGAAGDAAGRRPVARTRSERIEHVAKLMQVGSAVAAARSACAGLLRMPSRAAPCPTLGQAR